MNEIISAREQINGLLNQIAGHFVGSPRLTLVVRHPDLEAQGKDADFIMTNDTLEGAIAALERTHPRCPAGDGAPPVPPLAGGASVRAEALG